MFGNRLGWILSAVIVVLTGFFLFNLSGKIGFPIGEIGKNAANYTLEPPIPPRSLASWMTEGRGSSKIYQDMVLLYEKDPKAFEINPQEAKVTTAPQFKAVEPAIKLLEQASAASQGGVFDENSDQLINYDARLPLYDNTPFSMVVRKPLKEIYKVEQAAWMLAQFYESEGKAENNAAKTQRALDIYRAMYSLGVKLYEERYVFDEWLVGKLVVQDAAKYLKKMDESLGPKFDKMDSDLASFYQKTVQKVQSYIFSGSAEDTWTGDMVALATRAKERTWRVEAVLALGRELIAAKIPRDRKPHELVELSDGQLLAGKDGAMVVKVVGGSFFEKADLKDGTLITAIDGQKVKTADEGTKALEQACKKSGFKVDIEKQKPDGEYGPAGSVPVSVPDMSKELVSAENYINRLERSLQQIGKSDQAYVKRAAEQALGLTVEQWRKMGR